MEKTLKDISSLIEEATQSLESFHIPRLKQLLLQASLYENELLQVPIFKKIKDLLSKSDEELLLLRLKSTSNEQERLNHITALQDYNFDSTNIHEMKSIHLNYRVRPFKYFIKYLEANHYTSKLEQGCILFWTPQPLISSITWLQGGLETQSIKVTFDIMRYMGDIDELHETPTNPKSLVKEIKRAGKDHVDLRGEIYLQIIKQLVENPRSESSILGWELMSLLLQEFSPGGEFEDFLEFFLRKEKKIKFLKQLHVLKMNKM